jgi:hypothetical protein
MIKLINRVLKRFPDVNLQSKSARLTIAATIIKEMKVSGGWFLDLSRKLPARKSSYRPYNKEVKDVSS